MKFLNLALALALALALLLAGCAPQSAEDQQHDDPVGLHGGSLLEKDGVTLELRLEESTGTARFRAWAYEDGATLAPEDVNLTITLGRLGGEHDLIRFRPVGDVLVSDVIREPHSFEVDVELGHANRTHRWSYESLEGRTRIDAEMAAYFGLAVAEAGSAVISESVQVFGAVAADPARTWSVSARFPGTLRSVAVQPGDRVSVGVELARVESDESLKSYSVAAPASGVVVERRANVGEQTAGRTLFRIVDLEQVWAMFHVFPADRANVKPGQSVEVSSADGRKLGQGVIDWIGLEAGEDQSVQARVVLANPDGRLLTGMNLVGRIAVGRHEVDLAVRRSALQSFRDFQVVYRQVGDLYEVRMLSLGRQDEQWVEVLDGLNEGDVYVTENSYLVKADIDKDNASHDH